MYFTSSIGDAIRIPHQINDVRLVLLQPWRLTAHRSCSNDRMIHHKRAVPWTPSTNSSDLPPHLRHPPLPQLIQWPTQWCWGRHGYGKEVVHMLHHLLLYIHVDPVGLFWFNRKNIAIGNFPMALYYSIIHAFCWKEWRKTSTWTYFSKSYAWKQDQVH